MPFISLPTGNEHYNLGDKYPRGGLKLVYDWQITDKLYSALNLGFEARQAISNLNYKLKGRILSSLGLGYEIIDRLVLKSDFLTTTSINRPFKDKSSTGIDLLGGLSYSLKNHPVTVSVSAGGPIIQTAMQPQFQTNLGVSIGFGTKGTNLSARTLQTLQPTIHFDNNSSQIKSGDQRKLDRVAKLLQKHKDLRVVLAEGHTDSVGSKKHNKALSIRRATAAKNYLISKNIAKDRIIVKGYGEIKPVDSNKSISGKAKNRRVEIKIENQN